MMELTQTDQRAIILELDNVKNYLANRWVHNGLNLTVHQQEIIAIIGESGCGKTTLLRSILMLRETTEGDIHLFGQSLKTAKRRELQRVRSQWGVMFQSGALFSSMTVLENIMYPLQELTKMGRKMIAKVARLKLALVGLSQDVANLYPAELSGGMIKRVALARAIATDPRLIFLDEPTAGLDPNSAAMIDELVLSLRDLLGLTVMIVTHDLDTLWRVPDRVVFLGEGKVIAALPMAEMVKYDHPLVQSYFSNHRAALHTADKG